MRARFIGIFLVGAMTALLAIPSAGMAQPSKPLKPYSPDWLAKYHTMYDTPLTAAYESSLQRAVASGRTGPAAGRAW